MGSILLLQKWVHDAKVWEALPVINQERVIGRTKLERVELSEDVTGPTSHVARTTVSENGLEQKIFRRNTPYGRVEEHGTMFVGYSKELQLLQTMLERMAGIPDGIRKADCSHVRSGYPPGSSCSSFSWALALSRCHGTEGQCSDGSKTGDRHGDIGMEGRTGAVCARRAAGRLTGDRAGRRLPRRALESPHRAY